MSELDKLNKKRLALAKDREAVLSKLREKRVEFGRLATTPKSDPSYSSARYSNLEKDIAHLTEQEAGLAFDLEQAELLACLAAIPKPDPAKQAAQAARDSRRHEIESDLARVRADLETRRGGLGAAVLAGGDPGAAMAELTRLEQREGGLLAGLAALKNG